MAKFNVGDRVKLGQIGEDTSARKQHFSGHTGIIVTTGHLSRLSDGQYYSQIRLDVDDEIDSFWDKDIFHLAEPLPTEAAAEEYEEILSAQEIMDSL